MATRRDAIVDGVYETAFAAIHRLRPSERRDVLMTLRNSWCAKCGELMPCVDHVERAPHLPTARGR